MEKIDMAILVVGVVVLSAAIGGAAVYGGTSDLADFTVTWDTHETELPTQDASLDGDGGEEAFAFNVSQHNLTSATFTVTVNVAQTHLGGDEVQVAVVSPEGEEYSATGSISAGGMMARIEVPVELASIPSAEAVEAQSPTDAKARLDAEYGTTDGVGEWTVTVTVSHGGVGGFGSGHDVTVDAVLEHFEAHPAIAGGDPQGV